MDESRVPWDAGEMHPISGSFKLTRPRARAVRSDCSLTPLARRLHLRGRNSPYLVTALRSWSKCRRPTSPGRSTRGAVRAPGLAILHLRWPSPSPAQRSRTERQSRPSTPATRRTSHRRSPGAARPGNRELCAHRRRPRRAGRDVGSLGAVQPARHHCRAARERRQSRDARPGRRAPGAQRLPTPWVRRTVPAAGSRAPLFLQAVRARCHAAAATRRPAERHRGGDAGSHARHGPARGDLRAAEAMRLTLAAVLAGVALAPSFHVVVLPAAVRGVMSDRWLENNRHWDELAGQNTLTQLLGTGRPTQREYLACLEGEVVRDTLFVRRLQPARDLKQLQSAVAGTCDSVAGLVGTFHTHPYRADSAGRALKERGLSAMDLETFAASRDLLAVVMWDRDSLDVATKAEDGRVRHPAPLAVR